LIHSFVDNGRQERIEVRARYRKSKLPELVGKTDHASHRIRPIERFGGNQCYRPRNAARHAFYELPQPHAMA
jgi:hypothetical protein